MRNSTAEIRQAFLDFFKSKGHQVIASSSLVPASDATVLFTNAGMNQFKNIFLGQEKREYSRVTSVQRCVRAGGKHNDLEKVGYTARHHTFFEMLGNFSFGDYFKKEAISFAWELLTSPQWFNLPQDRLLVTVYETDDESFHIWEKDIGVPSARIIRIGDNKGAPYASDNFWQMSETGPCGPCSEIFFDHGEHLTGGPPGSTTADGDRYIEIWNLVFMQFNRQSNGNMLTLPEPSVDTGMGLERIAAVLQNVHSNYNIDIFQQLIQAVAKIVGVTNLYNTSLHVIADHIRSCAFLIADGVLPSNENRSYVLRRLIRRAVRHGYKLGAKKGFFFKLVDPLIHIMDSASYDLQRQQKKVEHVLKIEEEQCIKTLERGLKILEEELSHLSADTIPGEILFRLYDTFGFPMELAEDICRERNLKIDKSGFAKAMQQQRQTARNASNFHATADRLYITQSSEFKGYQSLTLRTVIILIIINGQIVNTIHTGQNGVIILASTPFYPEGGGQVGDNGVLKGSHNSHFIVSDTQKYNKAIGHHGQLTNGTLSIGDEVVAQVCEQRRTRICLNHSATHLLQAALRLILGPHVAQKGSFINENTLRFDFSHDKAMTQKEIQQVEVMVNEQIRRNLPIETNTMALEKAISLGAMAFFSETYAQYVRVLEIGRFSIELCGGTHVNHTGNIGLFSILSESGTAAGVRRVEATTGEEALLQIYEKNQTLSEVCQLIKTNQYQIKKKIASLIQYTHILEKDLNKLKNQQALNESKLLSRQAITVKGVTLLVSNLKHLEARMLRIVLDHLKHHLASAIIVLATVADGRVSLIISVSSDLTDLITATDLANALAHQVTGKSGGSPSLAYAGGINTKALPVALSGVSSWLLDKLER
ncbi:Alanine--tRNA ligase [Candidatus Erwinia haradaeae]|uniref:Alanine--tRNA ligase n=1 Tax=Candidatus Erwinia haradaeae TaxID=1922217 RepID=A0A451DDD7_9GAMM|nr:alanine--tRNA ligase [Candidatus Erwinia haradaeae]VFP84497.1 Alanine--tRNA ligase [Candidatus Erwinia haradaeae]